MQGFPFTFPKGGGNGPPPEGGDTRGGIRVPRGGMARDAIATINLNIY